MPASPTSPTRRLTTSWGNNRENVVLAAAEAYLALAARFARDAVFSAGDMEHY
jgi:hypothetical protein